MMMSSGERCHENGFEMICLLDETGRGTPVLWLCSPRRLAWHLKGTLLKSFGSRRDASEVEQD
jgi:hypothetical protein